MFESLLGCAIMNNWCFRPRFCTVKLYWAGGNLRWFCYESCPWAVSTCWPVVQRGGPWMCYDFALQTSSCMIFVCRVYIITRINLSIIIPNTNAETRHWNLILVINNSSSVLAFFIHTKCKSFYIVHNNKSFYICHNNTSHDLKWQHTLLGLKNPCRYRPILLACSEMKEREGFWSLVISFCHKDKHDVLLTARERKRERERGI